MNTKQVITSGMTDGQLIDYCETHCQTPRALFSREQVKRILQLAGEPINFLKVNEVDTNLGEWTEIREQMWDLTRLARMNEARRKKTSDYADKVKNNLHAGVSLAVEAMTANERLIPGFIGEVSEMTSWDLAVKMYETNDNLS